MTWRRMQFSVCCLCLLLAGPGAAQPTFSTTPWESPECGGSALGDYDNDGWPDVFRLQCRGTQVALMHNEGDGAFSLAEQTRSIQEALPPDKKLGYGQTFADYDNDGDLDLFVPVGMWDYGQRDRNVLLRNDRGAFTDVTLAAGLTDINNTDNVVWFDYDRDGYLDLYMGNPACGTPEQLVRNLLYRSRGDGTFEDMTAQAGLDLDLGNAEAEGGCGGGTNGGMAGADFNDDGWQDLYIAVFRGPNWLFLNDGQGHFRNATTKEIADPGQAFDVAVGDIDNDGDLDLFQAAGGLVQADRSLLLLNVGQGQFLDITEGAGVYIVGDAQDTGFGDIDNDGDLDLTLGQPARVFINDGHGLFTDGTAQTMGENAEDNYIPVAFWDYDLDGHLDGQGYKAFFHNQGNTNHSLRVELVGVKSNRNGIGARLFATSGELRQMREILGGRGFNQDEMVAHFGLGQGTKVDRLEIRWPSGQVDVLTDIPADQKIRVLEGSNRYYRVEPSVLVKTFPDSLVAGRSFSGALALRPALFEESARITQVIADLSALGGPAAAPLHAADDGTWQLETTLKLPDAYGPKTVSVLIDQQTSLGPYWTRLSRAILVLPAADQPLLAEGLAPGWTAEADDMVARLDLEQGAQVHTGKKAVALQGTAAAAQKGWRLTLQGPALGGLEGFTALGLAIHLGETPQAAEAVFKITIGSGVPFDLTPRLDLGRRGWQEIQVPLAELGMRQPLMKLVLRGTLAGTTPCPKMARSNWPSTTSPASR
ncbi:MAG: CRTAC1 family protein [Candidatus Latescibacteria bacterium]|nr:CRTAC1 family protein [Candidatus Latescibacterota bacterium]